MNLLKLCCVNINFARVSNLVEWGKKNRLTTSFGVIFVYFSLSHSTVVWRYLVWTVYHCTITTTTFKGKKEKYWHSKKKISDTCSKSRENKTFNWTWSTLFWQMSYLHSYVHFIFLLLRHFCKQFPTFHSLVK